MYVPRYNKHMKELVAWVLETTCQTVLCLYPLQTKSFGGFRNDSVHFSVHPSVCQSASCIKYNFFPTDKTLHNCSLPADDVHEGG